MNKKILLITLLSVSFLTGCTRNISSSTYSSGHVGESSLSYQGVIASVRQVTVTEAEKLQDNTAGMGLGALAGGLAGGAFGKGYGKLATAAGGAILGGVGGAFAQKALGEQQGLEYVVKLTNGQIMTIVQGPDNPMSIGQRVMVLVSNDGRSRIVPDISPTVAIQPIAQTPTIIKHK